jgi:hypothetical protein
LALGVRGSVRIGATIAGCALVAACTPEQPPAVTPTPMATPIPSPSVSPTETDIERQTRLDWEAAEKAYRAAVSEGDRLARTGGVTKATPKLSAVSTGEFLDLQLTSLKLLKSRKWQFRGHVSILGVKRASGWSSAELELLACEDNSTWRLLDQSGRDVTPKNQPDYIQTLTVKKDRGSWKVAGLSTRKVKNVAREDCA